MTAAMSGGACPAASIEVGIIAVWPDGRLALLSEVVIDEITNFVAAARKMGLTALDIKQAVGLLFSVPADEVEVVVGDAGVVVMLSLMD